MAKAGPREKIQLRSTGTKKNGKPTGYFKTTFKNKRNTTEKLALNKYDPFAWNEATGRFGKVVEFKEKKISK